MAMKRIEAAFTLSLGEFRMASYYGLFLRHRRALQILFGVLLFALVYYVGAVLGLGEPNPLVFLLAGAYLGWGLMLFAETERDIRRYLRTPQNLIACKFRMTIEDHRLWIEILEQEIRESCSLHKLACCFELNAVSQHQKCTIRQPLHFEFLFSQKFILLVLCIPRFCKGCQEINLRRLHNSR